MPRNQIKRHSRALLSPRAARKKPADPLPRIEAQTRNARTTWFALLAALVFVGVTLLGVEHIDFWGVNRETQLPLVNVSVPTRLFFGAAPILTAAIYCYFHLYLIRLWDALGNASPQVNGLPLGDQVTPWLVTDAALYLRQYLRGEDPPCISRRTMELPATLLNIAIAWVFGGVVLYYTWQYSLPARGFGLSIIGGFSFVAAAVTGAMSLFMLVIRMGPGKEESLLTGDFRGAVSVLVSMLIWTSYETAQRTGLNSDQLEPLLLAEAEIVERPDKWTDREYAMRDFRAVWCRREGIDPCEISDDRKSDFNAEWTARREVALTELVKPKINRVKVVDVVEAVESAAQVAREEWDGSLIETLPTEVWNTIDTSVLAPRRARAPNLQSADLRGAFLSGLDLSAARLAQTRLNETRLEGAHLTGADLRGAILTQSYLNAADLRWARMEGANLREARMEGANLSLARMEGANLREARMEGADLSFARMEGADLSLARMEGADLSRARMEGADLSFSLLTGRPENQNLLQSTNLRVGTNDGGTLRFVDLRLAEFNHRTDWRNAFLDGSVNVTKQFRARAEYPCQWTQEKLSDEVFYGRWRWWLEVQFGDFGWGDFAPEAYRDIPINPGPESCTWKAGYMNGPR